MIIYYFVTGSFGKADGFAIVEFPMRGPSKSADCIFEASMRNHGLPKRQGPSKIPVLLWKYTKDICEGVFGVFQEASRPEFSGQGVFLCFAT